VTGRRSIAIVLAGLLALGACDAKPQPSPSGSGIAAPSGLGVASPEPSPIAKTPACELIFKAEVATAIGVPIEDTEELVTSSEGDGWLVDCIYWRQPSHDQAPMELTLGSGRTYLDFFDSLKGEDHVEAEPGLGDEAVLRLATIPGLDRPVGSLFVRIGDAVLGLTLGIVGLADDGAMQLAGDGPKQTVILSDLATIAIRRLTGPPEVSSKTCQLIDAAAATTLLGVTIASAEDVDEHDVWGPSCRYLDPAGPNANDRWIDFWLAVGSSQPLRSAFDACRPTGEIVPGLGDDAYFATFAGPPDCKVKIGFYFDALPLMVRTGDTVVALGDGGEHSLAGPDRRERILAFARAVLAKLGAGPGATPPPVQGDALVHPCNLVSDADVGSILGTKIDAHFEDSANSTGTGASCIWSINIGSLQPLTLRLGRGTAALNAFNSNIKRNSNYQPIDGLGDEAFTEQDVNETDQPLVQVAIRKGDVVLELILGPVRQSADFLSYVAPGTPAQQTEMIRKLAGLILPRIFGG